MKEFITKSYSFIYKHSCFSFNDIEYKEKLFKQYKFGNELICGEMMKNTCLEKQLLLLFS